jgi:hypothetical protein
MSLLHPIHFLQDKVNTTCAEPLTTAEVDVTLIQTESYTFLQEKRRTAIYLQHALALLIQL